MKIFITGGTGFVGTHLAHFLLQWDNDVTIVGRSPERPFHSPLDAHFISADTTRRGKWQALVADHDAVINLAGVSIFRRWNAKNKTQIYESRILTTRNVVEALPADRETILCSTSAVGYYGFHEDETLTEQDGPGNDFLAMVCRDWEKEALKATAKGVRVIITRFGIVLGKSGGALKQMTAAFRAFLGGPLGSGRQWISWIHVEDLMEAMLFVIRNRKISGPLNFCSPNPVQQKHFARMLGKALKRPAFVKTPSFVIRVTMGELGATLLKGQRAIPARLLEHGYPFRYLDIESALHQIMA